MHVQCSPALLCGGRTLPAGERERAGQKTWRGVVSIEPKEAVSGTASKRNNGRRRGRWVRAWAPHVTQLCSGNPRLQTNSSDHDAGAHPAPRECQSSTDPRFLLQHRHCSRHRFWSGCHVSQPQSYSGAFLFLPRSFTSFVEHRVLATLAHVLLDPASSCSNPCDIAFSTGSMAAHAHLRFPLSPKPSISYPPPLCFSGRYRPASPNHHPPSP